MPKPLLTSCPISACREQESCVWAGVGFQTMPRGLCSCQVCRPPLHTCGVMYQDARFSKKQINHRRHVLHKTLPVQTLRDKRLNTGIQSCLPCLGSLGQLAIHSLYVALQDSYLVWSHCQGFGPGPSACQGGVAVPLSGGQAAGIPTHTDGLLWGHYISDISMGLLYCRCKTALPGGLEKHLLWTQLTLVGNCLRSTMDDHYLVI